MAQRRPPQRKRTAQPARANQPGDIVPPRFAGTPAVILASGPSLSREDIEYIRPLHALGKICVLGLNDTYKLCDFIDVLYFCDPRWLDSNLDLLDYTAGELWTQDANVRKKYDGRIKRCQGSSGNGLSKQPNHIHFGGNSGFQLLNLAWHFGIREMYLLGYNMGEANPGQRQHFFGPHPKPLNQSNSYKGFVGSFRNINGADKKMITNCTFPSALKGVFETKSLKEALPHNEEVRHIPLEESARKRTRSRKETASLITYGGADLPALPEQDSSADRDRSVTVAGSTGTGAGKTTDGRRCNLRD
jgi:hypothetical protein